MYSEFEYLFRSISKIQIKPYNHNIYKYIDKNLTIKKNLYTNSDNKLVEKILLVDNKKKIGKIKNLD